MTELACGAGLARSLGGELVVAEAVVQHRVGVLRIRQRRAPAVPPSTRNHLRVSLAPVGASPRQAASRSADPR